MDCGGGTSTGAANGTLGAGATYLLSTSGSCLYGSCLNFSGAATSFVIVPHANVPVFTTKLTVMSWVKGASLADKVIIGQHDSVTATSRSWVMYDSTGKLKVLVSCDGALTNYKSAVTTTAVGFDDTWHLVGFVFNAGTLSLYVDGVNATVTPTTVGTCTSLWNSPAALTMGADLTASTPTYANFFIGQIDDTKIYDVEIPTSQIKEQYYAGLNELLANGKISANEYSQRISTLSLNK